jgi:TRAP-type C4-dicarboxylate transport system permease small subunit
MILSAVRRLSNVGVWLAGLATMAMMVHITVDAVLRLFNVPIFGTLEIVSAYYMVAAVFLPIAVVELYQESISVDTVYQYLPRTLKFACMVVVFVASAIVYLMLAWTSWGDSVRSFQVKEVVMGTVPIIIWPSRFLMPVSLLLAGAVCLWHLWRLLTSTQAREELMATRGPQLDAARAGQADEGAR